MVRLSISDPTDLVFYVTFAPDTTELKELAAVAGRRWTIEEYFQFFVVRAAPRPAANLGAVSVALPPTMLQAD